MATFTTKSRATAMLTPMLMLVALALMAAFLPQARIGGTQSGVGNRSGHDKEHRDGGSTHDTDRAGASVHDGTGRGGGRGGRRLTTYTEVSTFSALSSAVLFSDIHVTIAADMHITSPIVVASGVQGVTISGVDYHQRGGDDTTLTILNGSFTDRLFFVGAGSDVTFTGIHFMSGSAETNNGGCVHVDNGATVSFIGAAFTSCTAANADGGGLYVKEATANLEGVSFSACSATKGGGIRTVSSTTTVSSVQFYNCTDSVTEDYELGSDMYVHLAPQHPRDDGGSHETRIPKLEIRNAKCEMRNPCRPHRKPPPLRTHCPRPTKVRIGTRRHGDVQRRVRRGGHVHGRAQLLVAPRCGHEHGRVPLVVPHVPVRLRGLRCQQLLRRLRGQRRVYPVPRGLRDSRQRNGRRAAQLGRGLHAGADPTPHAGADVAPDAGADAAPNTAPNVAPDTLIPADGSPVLAPDVHAIAATDDAATLGPAFRRPFTAPIDTIAFLRPVYRRPLAGSEPCTLAALIDTIAFLRPVYRRPLAGSEPCTLSFADGSAHVQAVGPTHGPRHVGPDCAPLTRTYSAYVSAHSVAHVVHRYTYGHPRVPRSHGRPDGSSGLVPHLVPDPRANDARPHNARSVAEPDQP
mmetsp:Transcript_22348/g.57176  ORF Transcript_22348/g.57176 Transcript_22348/m.57176 type:complete len:632 (+) Transcript_22348:163-2058(+)